MTIIFSLAVRACVTSRKYDGTGALHGETWQVPMTNIDMRMFAKNAGVNVSFPAGSVIFNMGDHGDCMYVVQSGVIDMMIGDKVIDVVGPNEAIGFMAMVDDADSRSSTARVREAAELSIIDKRKFRFMVDEVPNFALYIMGAMAHRIRGLSRAV